MSTAAADALTAAIAAGTSTVGFTYTTSREGEGRRVRWTGGSRNGIVVPDGDLTFGPSELAVYDRLLAAMISGGFALGR